MAARARAGPPGEARADPPADVLPRRLPHADDPAHAAGRRPRRAARARIAHRRRRADVADQGVRRADRAARPDDVRRAEPAHHATGWPRSTCRCRRGCARPGSAPACSGPRWRWTNWPYELGIDPVELRDPQRARARPGDREAVRPAGNLVECLRDGRAPVRLGATATRVRASAGTADWLVGTGRRRVGLPGKAACRARPRSSGSRTAATSPRSGPPTSAPAPGRCCRRSPPTPSACRSSDVDVRIGDTVQPIATVAGGSSGTTSWGSATWSRPPRRSATSSATTPADGDEVTGGCRPENPDEDATRRTRSARSSPRPGSTSTPARCGCRGCSACSRPAGSSTRAPRARSSSAA